MGTDKALIAHLYRRAGFGSTPELLEELSKKDYDNIVDDLVEIENVGDLPDEDILSRYYPQLQSTDNFGMDNTKWFYRMINSKKPLQEKMTLFWHHVFATGWTKSEQGPTMIDHIAMLRKNCLLNLRVLLTDLAADPAMIFWLDNCENHGKNINENFGRELLELFSMGIGNYSEDDIKEASRAFTGWTFEQPIPLYPYGHFKSQFIFDEKDHDFGEKEFLGNKGNFNGEDIVEIIVKTEACAKFISRHLYNFFVADEPQIPAWSIEPPKDQEAMEILVSTFMESDADMKEVMRAMFKSDFFKNSMFKRVKCPAEFIAGALKLTSEVGPKDERLAGLHGLSTVMGQTLLDPPTVEGWHTGKEWIDGGSLTERINYAVGLISDMNNSGSKYLVDSLVKSENELSSEQLVNEVLKNAGYLEVSEQTFDQLLEIASKGPAVGKNNDNEDVRNKVVQLYTLLVSSPEFQLA
ncbi:MAG: DUF1800 domain-containing protein [Chloroflexota bacterium]|nr:DUF1800 domain-containing protein [Chloroflexota bacterium]MED5254920.1 DUF1800 domain-containing protein [Chloroflexota bacterium]